MGKKGKGKRPAEAGPAESDNARPAKKGKDELDSLPAEWAEGGAGVEVSISEEDLPESPAELFLLAQEMAENPDSDDDVSVAQKLLETALERFKACKAKGAMSQSALYYYGQCLVSLAAQVLVVDFIDEALQLFQNAIKVPKTGKSSKQPEVMSLGAAPEASDVDVLAAIAQTSIEKARIEYVLSADDGDDEASSAKLKATLALASKHSEKCVSVIADTVDKVERLLSFSRALLNLAQGNVDDDLGTQAWVLDLAIDLATKALQNEPSSRPAKAQHAACLVAKADSDDSDDTTLLEQAAETLRESLGSDNPVEEAEQLQLLAQALIKLGQIHTDDEVAEKMIGEGIDSYRKAALLQPDNKKLNQLVQMIERQEAS